MNWRMYPILAIQEAPGEIISGGFVLFGRHFAMKAILPSNPRNLATQRLRVALSALICSLLARFARLKLRCSLFLPVPSPMQTRRSNSFYCHR